MPLLAGQQAFEGRRRRHLAALPIVLAALLAFTSAPASARTITVGPSLQGASTTNVTFLFPSLTVVNRQLTGPDTFALSPVDGKVVRWHVLPGAAGTPYGLRVLRPTEGGAYLGIATSAARLSTGTAMETYATSLPIKAGDAIGLDSLKSNSTIGGYSAPGHIQAFWSPVSLDGESTAPTNVVSGVDLGFNAEVQPAPKVALISPPGGGTGGGTTVTIVGSDFTGDSEVKFGTAPASSSVRSETEIVATAPAVVDAGPVDVTVTTGAGTSPNVSGDVFTYALPAPAPSAPPAAAPTPPPAATICSVPKLTGKNLRAARKALSAGHCKLGTVRGAKGSKAKVVKQNPKSGTTKPSGSAVGVKLG
jgi:hypothetical protein